MRRVDAALYLQSAPGDQFLCPPAATDGSLKPPPFLKQRLGPWFGINQQQWLKEMRYILCRPPRAPLSQWEPWWLGAGRMGLPPSLGLDLCSKRKSQVHREV